MRIQVRIDQVTASEAVRAHVERAIQSRLRRFSPRIRYATIQIVDINGPRGGVDKTCRIDIRLVPTGSVRIVDTDADMFAAVDRAVDRAERTVSRAIERVRDSERDPPRHAGARHPSTLLDADE